MLLPLWTPSPSMQREALPTGAVKPDVEAEPKDQLETILMCFKQTDLYVAKSIPKSLKFVDRCGEIGGNPSSV